VAPMVYKFTTDELSLHPLFGLDRRRPCLKFEVKIYSMKGCTGFETLSIPSNQMNVNQSQIVTVAVLDPDMQYGWKLEGIGSLSTTTIPFGATTATTTYTAPSTNPGCASNPTIQLKCGASVCASATISVSNTGIAGTAYYAGTKIDGQCSSGSGVCASNASYKWDKAYTCYGVLVGDAPATNVSGCPTCNQDPILGNCSSGCGCWTGSGWEAANPCNPSPSKYDVRTPAMIAAGCCPSLL
jgi:hypothetical protein